MVVKVHSLAELKQIKKAIAAREVELQLALAQEKAAALQKIREQSQSNLFLAAIGKTQALPQIARASLRPAPPPAVPLQLALDEAAALQEAWSDEVDISNLLETDAQLSYRRQGVGPDVPQNLRRGKWSIQRQIDLHGLRSDDAREALSQFIRNAHQQGIRCVRVVHGKGLGSPGKTPVLKDKVHRWLVQKNDVIAFVQAPPAHGGAGALLVLLKPGN
jgi:DNA-nicking Smr family endonuclease